MIESTLTTLPWYSVSMTFPSRSFCSRSRRLKSVRISESFGCQMVTITNLPFLEIGTRVIVLRSWEAVHFHKKEKLDLFEGSLGSGKQVIRQIRHQIVMNLLVNTD